MIRTRLWRGHMNCKVPSFLAYVKSKSPVWGFFYGCYAEGSRNDGHYVWKTTSMVGVKVPGVACDGRCAL